MLRPVVCSFPLSITPTVALFLYYPSNISASFFIIFPPRRDAQLRAHTNMASTHAHTHTQEQSIPLLNNASFIISLGLSSPARFKQNGEMGF